MSAIAGFWSFGPPSDPVRSCRKMLDHLAEYGPDLTATARLGDLAVGRNLFRLLPEDTHDRQPLTAGDGRYALVADVRLDNRDELVAAIGLDRPAAARSADAQILLQALLTWGEGALDRIEGDFAFAFFDASERRLLLARDPLGQRPLFWHRGRDFLAFASMPKGIHALDRAPRGADLWTIARYLGGLPPQLGARSFHEGLSRVEPGHVITHTEDGTSSRRYWTPGRRDLRLARFDDYVEAFRAQLDRAVTCRLRGAEDTVATHLSGGWDSAAVTATAARLRSAGGGHVVAFTAVPRRDVAIEGPPSRFADEGPMAAATAAFHESIEHRLLEHPDRSPIAELDREAGLFERPLFNPCNHVWLSEIRSAARAAGTHVLLTGEAGNWTISASANTLLADFLRQGRWLGWAREAAAMAVGRKARLRGIAASSFGPWLPGFAWKHLQSLSSGPEIRLQSAVQPRLLAAIIDEQERQFGLARPPKDNFRRVADALVRMDGGEYRKGVLGGWGIDKRDPTADRRLVEFCLSLPLDMLLHNGVRRPLARAALADRLPAAVLNERRKGYQASGWHRGLTRDLSNVRSLVERIGADAAAASVIDVELLRGLVRDWPQGGWEDTRIRARYRTALLQALSAGHFILTASR